MESDQLAENYNDRASRAISATLSSPTTRPSVPIYKSMSSIAGLFALLLLAFLMPQHAYSHEPVPTLPEEPAESIHPEHDQSGPVTAVPESRDTGDNVGQDMSRNNVGSHGMAGHGMADPDEGGMTMHHPGLPTSWVMLIIVLSVAIFAWAVGVAPPTRTEPRTKSLSTMPVIGVFVRFLNASPIPLFVLKIVTVCAFILVVISGFFGTVYPERNLATVLVWNWWWPLVVVSIFFLGSAWCAICPWDTLASWLVRRKLWLRTFPQPGLNKKVPIYLRNVWMALVMFIGLTWLELGVGVTSVPKATAIMALAMFGLSLMFLVLFERKAFCRYACPVGRTLGFYSRLAPVALRPKKQEICASCTTLECYRGSDKVEPCPTHLTIGKFSQNTYCLSCGNCVLSCPHKNVSWNLRGMGSEAMTDARPTWDGAWFMLILLGITTFHGVTMLPYWSDLVIWIARFVGETGKLVWSFTLGMIGGFALPVIIYAIAIASTMFVVGSRIKYRSLFVALPFTALPLAFTYHLAHNLNHLFREGSGVLGLIFNPLGSGMSSITGMERHQQMMSPAPEGLLFAMQTGLIVTGIWLAVHILRYRAGKILANHERINGWQLIPMLIFVTVIAGTNVWLLSQDMVMRF